MRQWLWKDTVDVVGQYYSSYAIIWAILSVVTIFIVCGVIDQLRIHIIERPLFKYLDWYLERNKNTIKTTS
jgi:hypothetical protein